MTSPEFGSVKFANKDVALAPSPLPIIYFDGAPSLSFLNGIIGITLLASGNVPGPNETVLNVASVVAHLKCSVATAVALKGAIENALLLAQPVEKPEGAAN